MSNSFVNYVYHRLLNEVESQDTVVEKKQKVKNVQATFAQARQDLAKMLDDKFADLSVQLIQSFGGQQATETRNQIIQVLNSIGDIRLVSEDICQINNMLIEAEIYAEDNFDNQMKIKAITDHLQFMKSEIMQKVDDTLKSLQNDAVMKMMTDIHKSITAVHGIVGGQSPLSATEKTDAYNNMQQLGTAIAMQASQKLPFGQRAPKSNSPVQIMLGGGYSLNYDPSDISSVKTAMGKIRNPRAVKIKIGNDVEEVDISNKQQMSNIISRAQEIVNSVGAQSAAVSQPRKRIFSPQKPAMPNAVGPGVE